MPTAPPTRGASVADRISRNDLSQGEGPINRITLHYLHHHWLQAPSPGAPQSTIHAIHTQNIAFSPPLAPGFTYEHQKHPNLHPVPRRFLLLLRFAKGERCYGRLMHAMIGLSLSPLQNQKKTVEQGAGGLEGFRYRRIRTLMQSGTLRELP